MEKKTRKAAKPAKTAKPEKDGPGRPKKDINGAKICVRLPDDLNDECKDIHKELRLRPALRGLSGNDVSIGLLKMGAKAYRLDPAAFFSA